MIWQWAWNVVDLCWFFTLLPAFLEWHELLFYLLLVLESKAHQCYRHSYKASLTKNTIINEHVLSASCQSVIWLHIIKCIPYTEYNLCSQLILSQAPKFKGALQLSPRTLLNKQSTHIPLKSTACLLITQHLPEKAPNRSKKNDSLCQRIELWSPASCVDKLVY